jgi:hypothetical protein
MKYLTEASVLDQSAVLTPVTVDRRRQQRDRHCQEYIRGPIPVLWIAAACRQGKLAAAVGVLVWFRAGCTRTRSGLVVSERMYQPFGLCADRFARGLRKLESAGLVTVDRAPGRKPRITIRLDATCVQAADDTVSAP